MSCQQSFSTKVSPHITLDNIPVRSTDRTTQSYNSRMRSPESEISNGTGSTAAVQSTDDNFFTGVSRKRSARYYLSGIDSKSTRSGIMTYLESRNVQVTYLRLFQSRNSLRYVSAKLNVSEQCANIIEGENFWPSGVHCRCWLSNQAWYQRSSEVPSDIKQGEN
ncbi:Hypothetical predicted protein [Mytilus galloprovincialis]|uniref:Uncharacterized protein n=1 Tax=Mytilus galloprovincialis TaxID=29158 RepID=A0A8B6BPP6_MYTGA|nr:Hypothetical predicted protein [Mytilus galloprovincialis]